jgi:toxin ParE1/3/4
VSRPATLGPDARADLRAALIWLANQNENAARALRAAVSLAARNIGQHPHLGRLRPNLVSGPYRFLPLPGTRYLVIYETQLEPPRIIRIIHTARDLPEVLKDLP